MELTQRKREFLEVIEQLYQKTGESVHYEDVAKELGVSKWTAYDMVQDLINAGFSHSPVPAPDICWPLPNDSNPCLHVSGQTAKSSRYFRDYGRVERIKILRPTWIFSPKGLESNQKVSFVPT